MTDTNPTTTDRAAEPLGDHELEWIRERVTEWQEGAPSNPAINEVVVRLLTELDRRKSEFTEELRDLLRRHDAEELRLLAAYKHVAEQGDRHARRLIEWREAAEKAKAELEEQLATVATFIDERAQFIQVLRNYRGEDNGDYIRWQGHAEARRVLAESMGLELDRDKGGLRKDTEETPTVSPLIVYGASDDLIETRGAVDEEFGAVYNGATTILVQTASGETVRLRVEHDPDGTGEWRLQPVSEHGRVLEFGHPLVTIVPARGEDVGDDADGCPGYSDKATVRGGFAVELEGVPSDD